MELERDCMVRAIFDVKGIDMGNGMVRYKAEMDLDGRQLARAYLDQLNMRRVLEVRELVLESLEGGGGVMPLRGVTAVQSSGSYHVTVPACQFIQCIKVSHKTNKNKSFFSSSSQ